MESNARGWWHCGCQTGADSADWRIELILDRQNLRGTKEFAALRQLAGICGIHESYEDVDGKSHEASPESLLATLRLLSANIQGMGDVEKALKERLESNLTRCLEPVMLSWDGTPSQIQLQLRSTEATGAFAAEIEEENGEMKSWSGRLENLAAVNAGNGATNTVNKVLAIPGELPLGYHKLRVEIGSQRSESLLLSAPTRAYAPRGQTDRRSWGAFVPLYALRSERNWGAGDFRDLRELKDGVQGQGADFIGPLPLLAAFLDEPFEIS